MDGDQTRPVRSGGRAPEVVPWPSRQDRRAEAARSGVPCLLVVEPGSVPPPIGDREDWVLAGASEQDVAARLDALVDRSRARPAHPMSAPVLPPSLSGVEARVARTLVGRSGSLVRWADLAVDGDAPDARQVIERVRGPLRDDGWTITAVGSSGVVASREQGT